MQKLSFSGLEGRHSVYSRYAFQEIGGVTFIGPADGAKPTVYDPLKSPDVLLLYVMAVADIIMSCAGFWEYCAARSGGRISDGIFFMGTDFLSGDSADARRIKQVLLSFAGKYGLPEYRAGTVELELPDRYAHLPVRGDSAADAQDAAAEAMTAVSRDMIPAGAMALIMAELYERFLSRGGEFASMRRTEMTFRRVPDGRPELRLMARGLTSCVDMAYISIVCGRGGELRRCKRCGKFFIASDARTQYCTKRCRGAYNSAASRRRKREEDIA